MALRRFSSLMLCSALIVSQKRSFWSLSACLLSRVLTAMVLNSLADSALPSADFFSSSPMPLVMEATSVSTKLAA